MEKAVIPLACLSLVKTMLAKKLLLILFLATILLYAVAVFRSIQAYEEWKKLKLESYPPEVRPYMDFHPYLSSRQGGFMIVLGATLGIAWLMAVVILDRLKARKPINRRT